MTGCLIVVIKFQCAAETRTVKPRGVVTSKNGSSGSSLAMNASISRLGQLFYLIPNATLHVVAADHAPRFHSRSASRPDRRPGGDRSRRRDRAGAGRESQQTVSRDSRSIVQ